MESVTNTKHTPGAPGLNTLASEPKADARGGQFERQIKPLSERKDALKKGIGSLGPAGEIKRREALFAEPQQRSKRLPIGQREKENSL